MFDFMKKSLKAWISVKRSNVNILKSISDVYKHEKVLKSIESVQKQIKGVSKD